MVCKRIFSKERCDQAKIDQSCGPYVLKKKVLNNDDRTCSRGNDFFNFYSTIYFLVSNFKLFVLPSLPMKL